MNLSLLKGGETMKKIQIFGERLSGTNYLEDLIYLNLKDVTVTDAYGHKHMFNKFKQRRQPDENALYIFIHRNPYDWLRSMSKQPHHTQYWDMPFSEFLRQSPWISDIYDGPRFKGEYSGIIEEVSGNVIDLRNEKNRLFNRLWLPGKSVLIRYEDLRKDPEVTLRTVSEDLGLTFKGDFANTTTTRKIVTKKGNAAYTRKTYDPLSQEDLDFINSRLDWYAETRIGYHRIKHAESLESMLQSLYG